MAYPLDGMRLEFCSLQKLRRHKGVTLMWMYTNTHNTIYMIHTINITSNPSQVPKSLIQVTNTNPNL